jgi:hypothetical protein
MRILNIFERRELWAIGIYKLKSLDEILNLKDHLPSYMIGEQSLRKNLNYQSTVADPFLFVYLETLYLFYEVKTDHGHGEIWAQSLSKEGYWISHGKVLGENFHLSYPQVFEHEGGVYMIPEAARSGKVLLYSSEDFPIKWKLRSVLVNEPLLDPTVIFRKDEGIFLLATTRNDELKLYHSAGIHKPFADTGIFITKDKSISRCAGSPLYIEGSLHRLAQDCANIYGERIRFLKIKELSICNYNEEPSFADLYTVKPDWMRIGYHHLSAVEFEGVVYAVVDGRKKDRYINTLMLGLLKIRLSWKNIIQSYIVNLISTKK